MWLKRELMDSEEMSKTDSAEQLDDDASDHSDGDATLALSIQVNHRLHQGNFTFIKVS